MVAVEGCHHNSVSFVHSANFIALGKPRGNEKGLFILWLFSIAK